MVLWAGVLTRIAPRGRVDFSGGFLCVGSPVSGLGMIILSYMLRGSLVLHCFVIILYLPLFGGSRLGFHA